MFHHEMSGTSYSLFEFYTLVDVIFVRLLMKNMFGYVCDVIVQWT